MIGRDLRLVDVSQRHIGKSRVSERRLVDGHMGGISAVRQKHMDARRGGGVKPGKPRLGDLGGVVGKSRHLRIQVFKIYASEILVHDVRHVGAPGKAHQGGACPHLVMVSGDDHHPHAGDSGKQIIDLL